VVINAFFMLVRIKSISQNQRSGQVENKEELTPV
jgi:hypothetical protein